MKKLYFSTFVQGLEKPIEAMLHKEGGVSVERIVPGAAIYRSVREPVMPFMHQTFQVLFQMRPVANVNEAVKRLMSTGTWLDHFPYGEMEGKRFRIVTAEGDKLVSANMRFVDMLESAICDNTGMRTNRERPDVELWVLCRPEAAYFLWRIGKRSTTKQDGQLRSDVSAVISFLSTCGNENAAVLGCTGASIPMALKNGGARTVTCVCSDRATAKGLQDRVRGIRVCEGNGGFTDLADSSQGADVVYLPVKAEKTERLESDLRSMLYEARRILNQDGKLIVVASAYHAEATLRKTQGVRALARYNLTLSGQKSAIWVFCLQEDMMVDA